MNNMIRSPETEFLTRSFGSLGKLAILYAVLRNAETLPDSLAGGDVDILVASGNLEKAACCLADSAESCGGRVMGVCRYPCFQQMMFMGYYEGQWWGCCIDLFEGVFCQGVLPIVGDNLLARRVQTSKDVWTLDWETGQYLGFVKELITNGEISQRYILGAKLAIEKGKDDFLLSESLRSFVRKTKSKKSHSAIVFRIAWKVSMALRHPISFWRKWFGFQISRLWRLVRPCGKVIAVLGTDGAGKSTLLDSILPVIHTMNHNSTVVHHLKPDLLPPLGRFRGVKHKDGFICSNPHGSKPSGFAGSLFRTFYLTCDYILGYWLKVRFKIAKTPIAYWIFDRYAYDLLIDSRRFRIQLPQLIIKSFLLFVPRPDLVLCLGGDPEKIFARKQETSLDEVRRQVALLQRFCAGNKRAVWIDTTVSVEESSNQALKAILTKLAVKGGVDD